MKKLLKIFLCILIITMFIPTVVYATTTEQRVFDDANLFMDGEIEALNEGIQKLKATYQRNNFV